MPRSGITQIDPIENSDTWGSLEVILHCKCRKCSACLRYKAAQWVPRIEAEIDACERSWFMTFTFKAEEHYRVRLQAVSRLRAKGVSFDHLPVLEQEAELMAEFSADFTKYAKRLRKSGAQFRYFYCAEPHKNGLPHGHALLHEVNAPITKSQLQAAWTMGFTTASLVRHGAKTARYVAKYLTKCQQQRVRCSLAYGQTNTSSRHSELEWNENDIVTFGEMDLLSSLPLGVKTGKETDERTDQWD